MTKTAEQVLAEVAKFFHGNGGEAAWPALEAMTAPYLPKPEPDRLTLAAEECVWSVKGNHLALDPVPKIRAIIAREVAAAEPSDEAIERVMHMIRVGTWRSEHDIRAALKGEGA